MTRSIARNLGLLACICLPGITLGQYTYAGAAIGQKQLDYSDDSGNYRQLYAEIHGLVRPLRRLGAGLGVQIPVKGSDLRPPQPTSTTSDYFFLSMFGPYEPGLFTYKIEQSVEVFVNVRFFLDTKVNAYIEGGLHHSSFTEHLRFQRAAVPADPSSGQPAIEAATYDLEQSFSVLAPEVKAGIMPMLGKWMYVDLNAGWQFLEFEGTPLTFTVPAAIDYENETHDPATFDSPLPGKRVSFNLSAGIGRYF